MNPKLTETIYVDFVTSSPTTGAAADADSTPTCEVFEDASDTAILAPTVAKRTGKTGNYRVPVACTSANGFEAAKSYNVVVSAAVGAVAAKAVIRTFQVRTNSVDDITGGGGGGDASQATLLAVKAKTDALPTDPADASDIAASFATVNGTLSTISGYVDTEVAAIKAKTDNLPTDPASASSIAASFTNTNSKIDAVDDYVDTEVAAIKAKTDQLTFTGGKVDANATLAIAPTDLNAIADALLKRDWNSVTGEAAYSALNAFRMLRNAWNTTGGVLSVKKEDGASVAWTRVLATDAAADPIIGAS